MLLLLLKQGFLVELSVSVFITCVCILKVTCSALPPYLVPPQCSPLTHPLFEISRFNASSLLIGCPSEVLFKTETPA